jgi:hypothetical protein
LPQFGGDERGGAGAHAVKYLGGGHRGIVFGYGLQKSSVSGIASLVKASEKLGREYA